MVFLPLPPVRVSCWMSRGEIGPTFLLPSRVFTFSPSSSFYCSRYFFGPFLPFAPFLAPPPQPTYRPHASYRSPPNWTKRIGHAFLFRPPSFSQSCSLFPFGASLQGFSAPCGRGHFWFLTPRPPLFLTVPFADPDSYVHSNLTWSLWPPPFFLRLFYLLLLTVPSGRDVFFFFCPPVCPLVISPFFSCRQNAPLFVSHLFATPCTDLSSLLRFSLLSWFPNG